MRTFFPYNLLSTQVVELEPHKIIGGKIRLDHIPKEGSLTVRGFIEASSAANLQSNEFFCSYRADSQYREANRLVYFYSGRSGQTVYCSYIAVGTVVTADDMNEIGEFMKAADKNFSRHDESLTALKNTIVETRNEARTSLNEHNKYLAAHSDIRDDISNLARENLAAHSDIYRRITDNENALTAHKAQVIADRNQAFLEHNTSATAHQDIRNALSNETAARIEADDNIISDLNTEVAARQVADNALTTNLNAEAQARAGADNALATDLNSEISARKSADNALGSSLNSETQNRIAADDALELKIGSLSATLADEVQSRLSFNVDTNTFIDYVFDNGTFTDDDVADIFDDSDAGELTDEDIDYIFG